MRFSDWPIKLLLLMVLAAVVLVGSTARSWGGEPKAGEPVNGLRASLKIQGSTFKQGQGIPIELELQNVSNTPVSLYQQLSDTLYLPGYVRFLVVRLVDGTSIEIIQLETERVALTADQAKVLYTALEPGALLKRQFTMRPEYHGVNSHSNPASLEPGLYELRLEVIFDEEGRVLGVKDAWVGTVISNPARFRIVGSGEEKR